MDQCPIYDRHERIRALVVPSGVALIILGFSLSWFLRLLPSGGSPDSRVIASALDKVMHLVTKDIVDYSFGHAHIIASVVFVLLIVLGILVLRSAMDDDHEFRDAYPRIADPYTPEDRCRARTYRTRCLTIGALVLTMAAVVFWQIDAHGNVLVARGVRDLLVAVGVWLVVHGHLMGGRVDVFAHNFEAVRHSSIYKFERLPDGPEKRILIGEK